MRSKILTYKIQSLHNSAKGYIQNSADLSLDCFLGEGTSIQSFDFLISTGIYREDHIVEPALSALILGQMMDKIGKNEFMDIQAGERLKSFDIQNGNSGLIQAMQLADLMIKKGEANSGLITAGDYIRNPDHSQQNNLSNGAAAILLSKSEDDSGFSSFYSQTFTAFETAFEGYSSLQKNERKLIVSQTDQFKKQSIDCSFVALESFIRINNIAMEEVDYIVSSSYASELSKLVQGKWNFRGKIFDGNNKQIKHHSASLIYGLDHLFKRGTIAPGQNIVFLVMGSGITVSLAHYIS